MGKQCVICGEYLPEENFAGEICVGCADAYDLCGVYFILGSTAAEVRR
jgi:hypothetical protein